MLFRSIAALTAAMDPILGEPDTAGRLAEQARREALQRFAPDAAASRYLGIYQLAFDAAASRAGSPPPPRDAGAGDG